VQLLQHPCGVESTQSTKARASVVSRGCEAYQGISLWIPFFFLLVDSVLLLFLGAFAGLALVDLLGLLFAVALARAEGFPLNSVATSASVAVSFGFIGEALVPGGVAGSRTVPLPLELTEEELLDEEELLEGGSVGSVEALTGGAELLSPGLLDDSVGDTVSALAVCVEPELPFSGVPAAVAVTVDVVAAPPCSMSGGGPLTSPGGFKFGGPVLAAICTFGELFTIPSARWTMPGRSWPTFSSYWARANA
jgi:hypothetical protein